MDSDEAAKMGRSAGFTGGGAGGGAIADALDKGPKARRSDHKTVTFGDAGAVVSSKKWNIVGIVTLFASWFLATRAWGYPDDFREAFQLDFLDDGSTGNISDRELFQRCQLTADCDVESYFQLVNPLSFPSIRDTWNAGVLFVSDGYRGFSAWQHTWASLWRVLRGMFWGSIVGIPIGLAMGLSSKARGFFDPLVEAGRPIPPLALLSLFAVTFGIGDASAVPLLIFASIWIMIIAARAGVRNASLPKVRASYSLGASKWQLLSRVLLPNALPEIFTGLRVALGVSWGTLVAAELTGVTDGLGATISQAKNFSQTDTIVVGIVIIALIGVLMDIVLRFLERLLVPWQGKS